MQKLGVPYSNQQIDNAIADAKAQAEVIAADLKASGENPDAESEMIALIAYLQKLGTDNPRDFK